jgi:hypothetical protein
MANAMYAKGLEAFLTGQINWENDAIKAVLIDFNLYTPNLNTHQFLSDIPSGARVAISPALTAKSALNGVADAADITFPTVSGAQSEAVALFKDTGSDVTSRLICLIDTATGLPVTPGGGDISLVWDNGINKIFRL